MIMEEIDKILEDEILREFKENRRGFLNKLRSKSYQHVKQYIWDRFPMLQCKKYSFGMRLYWLENAIGDFPKCVDKQFILRKITQIAHYLNALSFCDLD